MRKGGGFLGCLDGELDLEYFVCMAMLLAVGVATREPLVWSGIALVLADSVLRAYRDSH